MANSLAKLGRNPIMTVALGVGLGMVVIVPLIALVYSFVQRGVAKVTGA